MPRHIIAVLNPRTGTHRLGLFGTEAGCYPVSHQPQFTPAIAQALAPKAPEVLIVFAVPETPEQPAPPPRPTLKAVR